MSHQSFTELSHRLSQVITRVSIGQKYIHCKYPEKRYLVLDFGIQEATEKTCVIYCDIDMPSIHFVRDFESFNEKFTKE